MTYGCPFGHPTKYQKLKLDLGVRQQCSLVLTNYKSSLWNVSLSNCLWGIVEVHNLAHVSESCFLRNVGHENQQSCAVTHYLTFFEIKLHNNGYNSLYATGFSLGACKAFLTASWYTSNWLSAIVGKNRDCKRRCKDCIKTLLVFQQLETSLF